MIAILMACTPIDPPQVLIEPWVHIEGNAFWMGSPDATDASDEQHEVEVPSFGIMRHEILSTDYWDCVADGSCTPPRDGCADGTIPDLPQNCIPRQSAADFCSWFGGRLPTESEWEFAATSGGTGSTYPWGEEPPDCERANITQEDGSLGCPETDALSLWSICTHPLGDTPWGLCDMGGNVFEWTADQYHPYDEHPTDGTAQTSPGTFAVMRGGSRGSEVPPTSRHRTFHEPDFDFGGMGARCATDL